MQIFDFLPPDLHRTILGWALLNEDRFRPSAIGEAVVETDFRRSLALADLGPCKDILRDAIKPRLGEVARAFGLSNYQLKGFDGELAAHNDGAFYKAHIDTGQAGSSFSTRLISAVYYFHRSPKAFSGGELRLFRMPPAQGYDDLMPVDNSLVLFPAFRPHEVRPVSCKSRAFADSRFAINIWAHRLPA